MRRQRAGYVLVMALALIMLAGFLLAGIARTSLSAAVHASNAREQLQRRWGAISCQRVFLDPARGIFQSLENSSDSPGQPETISIARQIVLGDFVFDLRLADECAKANLNAAFAARDQAEAIARLCRAGTAAGDVLRIDIRPTAGNRTRPFDSWGQVFSVLDGTTLEAAPKMLAESTKGITCWGSGKLNVRRAPDEVLRAVARLVASQKVANELLQFRRRSLADGLRRWISAVGASQQERTKLARVLDQKSNCFSLWIVAKTARREWHELIVYEFGANNDVRTSRFHW